VIGQRVGAEPDGLLVATRRFMSR